MLPRHRMPALAGMLAVLGLLAATAVPGGPVARVLAHAQLVASSPAAGAVLEEPPDELRLVFSEPLERQVTSVDVVRSDGTLVLEHAGEVDPDDPYALVVSDPGLGDGVYTVNWRSLSAADGHTADGFISFAIGESDQAPIPSSEHAVHSEADPLGVIGRWLTYLGLIGALGLAAFVRFVLRERVMTRPLRRLVAAALAVTAVASLAMAVAAGLEAGAPLDFLGGSRTGTLLAARAAIAAIGAGALVAIGGRASIWISAVVGLTGINLLVAAGHASAVPGPVAIASGAVHVAAVAIWLGGVAGLLLILIRPAWIVVDRAPTVRTIVPRFSALALVSIGLVVVTGAYAAWVQTGMLLPIGTEYGRTLITKAVLAAGAFAMGSLNFLDGGRMRAWLDGFRTRLSVEAMAAAAVLVMSAALATTPPTEEPAGVAIAPIPDAFGEVAPNMGLEVVPGRPGVNRVVVKTTPGMSSVPSMELALDRLDEGSTTRVPLVLEGMIGMENMPGMVHEITPDADGRISWIADAIVLPADSRWDASVLALASDGTELTRQRFSFGLSENGISEGRAQTWLTWGTLIAAALAVGGAVGLGLGIGGATLPLTESAASRVALMGGGVVGVALGILIGLRQLTG